MESSRRTAAGHEVPRPPSDPARTGGKPRAQIVRTQWKAYLLGFRRCRLGPNWAEMARLEHIRLAVQPNAAGAKPRSKLGYDDAKPVYILTAHGVGDPMAKAAEPLRLAWETAASGSLVLLGSTLELPAPTRCGAATGALPGASAAPDSDARRLRRPAGSRRALNPASGGRRRGRGDPDHGRPMGGAVHIPGLLRDQGRGDRRDLVS